MSASVTVAALKGLLIAVCAAPQDDAISQENNVGG